MTLGRIVAAFLILAGLLAGGAMYYLQVYAYYDTLPARDAITLTPEGAISARVVPVRDFRGIDSDSSPLRYRACFTIDADLDGITAYADPSPLIAPRWFDCFDAEAVAAALAAGEARAYLARANFEYGFDRVVAVYDDGSAVAWHQMNRCGAAVYDGLPPPEGCPPPPEDD